MWVGAKYKFKTDIFSLWAGLNSSVKAHSSHKSERVLGCIHTCLVWFDWIELKFVSPLGADLLGRCEYSNHTRVRTKQPYWDPAEEVVSVRFQTNSGTVEWMNQWMDDLKHTWFCLQFLAHLQKGQCESEPHQTKKNLNRIWSGPKQVNYFPVRITRVHLEFFSF